MTAAAKLRAIRTLLDELVPFGCCDAEEVLRSIKAVIDAKENVTREDPW